MKIYLFRHAEAFPRMGLLYEQDFFVNLTPFGKCQARKMKAYIKEISPQIFFSSPMVRAKETLQILNYEHKPFIIEDRLKEFFPPDGVRGKDLKKIKREVKRNRNIIPGSGGESFAMCAKRFIDVINEISQKPYEVVVIVTHAFVMECGVTTLFGLKEIPRFDLASVSLILYENGEFKIKFTNQSLSSSQLFLCSVFSFPEKIMGKLGRLLQRMSK